jgi:phage-related baseplate assembly protein
MTIAKTPTEIEAEVLARYTLLTGKTLLAADPRRLLLQAVTEKLSHCFSLIELADLRNLPFDADGASLLNLGTFVGVAPSAGQASVTTIQYTRTVALVDLVILAGHRTTTPDGAFLWATIAELTLPAGVLSGTVSSRCTVTGPESNDLPPGAIDTLVDPIAGVTVTNTTTTAGGADAQTDDEFRPAVIAAPDGFTTCGPSSAYAYHARQASPYVLDAAVLSSSPGDVEVYLLLGYLDPTTGALVLITDPAVIADTILLVETALSASEVRPLTDNVTVIEGTEVPFTVQVDYWIHQDNAGVVADIQAAVDAAQDAYCDWQESELGRDVNPTELIGLLRAAGAGRVAVTSPTFLALAASERAVRDAYVVAPNYLGLYK